MLNGLLPRTCPPQATCHSLHKKGFFPTVFQSLLAGQGMVFRVIRDVVMHAGSTQKVKVSPGKSATAAKKAVQSGGKSLGGEDTGTTVGTYSMSLSSHVNSVIFDASWLV